MRNNKKSDSRNGISSITKKFVDNYVISNSEIYKRYHELGVTFNDG